MGSLETGGGVDTSVGSIVWVRRRNGSWWPGKVLGPDELSSSHLTYPRSGTPVKLLGREDASVDWYNLEKSKRVKAFRCGEFDDCIERAEAAQSIPPKKREKYARREDAILHAIELERQFLEKKYGKLEFSINDRGKRLSDSVTYSEYVEDVGRNQTSPRSKQISEERGSSPTGKNVTDNINGETLREGNQLSGDDSNACILPRMRGLQDFGIRTAPIREELSGVVFCAKRSRYAYLGNDSGNNLNDSGVQPSEMEIPVSKFEDSDSLYLADVGEEPISGSTEDTETDCSETDPLESDSDDDICAFSDGSASIELQPKYPMKTEAQEEHGSISSNDLEGLILADELSHPFSSDLVSTSMGESKWQLKGKRNNRCLGKRSLERINAEAISGTNSNWNSGGFKGDTTRRRFMTHLQDPCHNTVDFKGLTYSPPAMGGHEYLQECVDPLFVGTHNPAGRIILVDVDLKVQASDYKRDIPLISLISKLNGHAIVGHPIQIETLENGSSEYLLAGTEYLFSESLESPPVLPRAWRTGRRTTNFRVPRPNIFSALDCGSRHKTLLGNQDRKLPFGSEQVFFSKKENITRNRLSQCPVDGKPCRNSLKKMSISSNQRIRTLSSIESEQKHHNNPTSGVTDDGLMKLYM